MSYDGYGRLASKHVPEQDANTATSYSYNNDDTINSVTDARGASATYSYNNNRHLVNEIDCGAPSGVTPTGNVAFDYDAAGNRRWMTDGSGRVDYSYDQLSRIQSETRQINGLTGTFTLAYEYNLANQVKSVTDQRSGTSFSNVYDSTGRVNSVSAVGYNGSFAQFASQVQYRAWGAVKSLTYGNGTAVSMGYNSRGLMSNYSVSGVNLPWLIPPQNMTVAASYQYHDDGQVKLAEDQATTNSIRVRAYRYDQAGRIAEAYSGTEARDFVNQTNSGIVDGPYRQSYSYDAWDNMLTSGGRYWSRTDIVNATYDQANRNPNWSYDAEGNLLSRSALPNPANVPHYDYDVAGRDVSVSHTEVCRVLPQDQTLVNIYTNSQTYDGDGQSVSSSQSRTVNGSMAAGWPKTTYYLRSRPATRIQLATVEVSAPEAVACSLENPETCEACQ